MTTITPVRSHGPASSTDESGPAQTAAASANAPRSNHGVNAPMRTARLGVLAGWLADCSFEAGRDAVARAQSVSDDPLDQLADALLSLGIGGPSPKAA